MDTVADPRPISRPTLQSRPLIEPEQQFDMRPEFAVRASVLHDLLSDLGASVEFPPEDGEKQRKAARVGAKRRLAVIARNDPDLMLDELGDEADRLLMELFELGPLTEILDEANVREILIRAPHRIYVDRGRGRERLDSGFSCAESVVMALRRLVGKPLRWDASAPWLDHRMADGTRLRGADASVAPGGPVVVISRPSQAGVGGLSQVASMSDPVADYLRSVLRASGSVLVCLGQGCEGNELASALAHELSNLEGGLDAGQLAIVRAGGQLRAPNGTMVFDAEPGLTATPIRLAVDTGSTSLLVHRGGGAGLASAWSGLGRGLTQLVLCIGADDPAAGLEACVDGLLLGGYGRDREILRQHVAATISVVVGLGLSPRGEEAPVTLAELDGHGGIVPILSRASADQPWQHHRDPSFVAEMAGRGVTFDPASLTALARR